MSINQILTGNAREEDYDRISQQLKDVQCRCVEGTLFYRLVDILDALDIPENPSTRKTVSSWIDRKNKQYIWKNRRTRSGKEYYYARYCYVNSQGADQIFCRYGGRIPRAALMEALPVM